MIMDIRDIKRGFLYSISFYSCWYWVNLLFKRRHISGKERIPQNKPVMFIPNHQNAFLDAFSILFYVRDQVKFMTRGDVFKKVWMRKLLMSYQMIPIFRARDGREAVKQNEDIIAFMTRVFKRNGKILLFPEANCKLVKHIRPLRRGAAKIAISAYKKGATDLVLLPVGLVYEHHTHYRRDQQVRFGTPISLADYDAEIKNGNTRELEQHLTAEFERQLKANTIHIDKTERQASFDLLSEIDKQVNKGKRWYSTRNMDNEFEREQVIAAWLNHLDENDVENIQSMTQSLLSALDRNKTSVEACLSRAKDAWNLFSKGLFFLSVGGLPLQVTFAPFFHALERFVIRRLPEDQFIFSGRVAIHMYIHYWIQLPFAVLLAWLTQPVYGLGYFLAFPFMLPAYFRSREYFSRWQALRNATIMKRKKPQALEEIRRHIDDLGRLLPSFTP